MSTENNQPAVPSPVTCCVFHRCCCKCLFLTAILVGLVGAGLTWFLFPVHYESTAWLIARSQAPYIVFHPYENPAEYENYLATQIAMIRSPAIMRAVSYDPRVAAVGSLRQSHDQLNELRQRIQVQRQGKSECFTISYRDPDPNAAQTVVQAVVDAYLKRVRSDEVRRGTELVENLRREMATFENSVKTQQRVIADLTEYASNASNDDPKNMASISFLEARLQKDIQVLDKLSERIIQLQTESQAPARVSLESAANLPTEPCTQARLPLSILVGVGLFLLTFICAGVRRFFGN